VEKTLFKGVFAALTTPFCDEKISLEKFRENLLRYNTTGLAGYVVLGSTGEAVFLSDEEGEKMVTEAKSSASADKIVIAGANAESTALAVRQVNRLAELGADAALLKPPHYYKSRLDQEVLRDHFLRVADEARIPLIIYNIPQNTGVPVEPPLIIELARHPNIAAIKDSSGLLANLAEVRAAVQKGFSYLIGTGSIFLAGLLLGADGGILALAAVAPELCVRLYSLFRAGELDEAAKLQLALGPLNKALTQTLGVPAIKHALDLIGAYGGAPRPPLKPLDEAGRSRIEKLLLELDLMDGAAKRK